MNNERLVELTADIVSAHVSNNSVAISDVPIVLQRVHDALSSLGVSAPKLEEKNPAVSIRASVKPDYLVCLECGRKQKSMKRHLQTAHDMTPAQYRAEFGLSHDYPMVAPNYSETRRAMAKRIGLGRKKGATKAAGAAKPTAARAPRKPRAAKRAGRSPTAKAT